MAEFQVTPKPPGILPSLQHPQAAHLAPTLPPPPTSSFHPALPPTPCPWGSPQPRLPGPEPARSQTKARVPPTAALIAGECRGWQVLLPPVTGPF